ncbi:MAG: hypothetical protein ACR2NF_05210 [Pirellulales bacterium]
MATFFEWIFADFWRWAGFTFWLMLGVSAMAVFRPISISVRGDTSQWTTKTKDTPKGIEREDQD